MTYSYIHQTIHPDWTLHEKVVLQSVFPIVGWELYTFTLTVQYGISLDS